MYAPNLHRIIPNAPQHRRWLPAGLRACRALPCFVPLLFTPAAAAHHPRPARTATATFYRRGDSNPHLANGDYYASSGVWFCAVDESRRSLLNHRIRVINTRNGRSHIFLVSDLGRFARGNVDISRGGSSRLSGRGRPDSFPVTWHDLGLAPGGHHYHKHQHDRHLS